MNVKKTLRAWDFFAVFFRASVLDSYFDDIIWGFPLCLDSRFYRMS